MGDLVPVGQMLASSRAPEAARRDVETGAVGLGVAATIARPVRADPEFLDPIGTG